MAKTRTSFVCQQCGYATSKWLGQCPSCQAWGSLVETIVSQGASTSASNIAKPISPILLSNIVKTSTKRLSSGIGEFDRVLGGGIAPGMAVLIAGEPGIGKSTLLLELAAKLVKQNRELGIRNKEKGAEKESHDSKFEIHNSVLYVAGEESPQQIKIRADRLGVGDARIHFAPVTDVDVIAQTIEQLKPAFVIVDSVQTISTNDLTSAAGSVGQVRECVDRLTRLTKELNIPTFFIGHVTKEGSIAGPKTLEHIVDTVLVLEGDNAHSFRILRATKNRFGSTDEIGVFSMEEEGLKEVTNASKAFLAERLADTPGSVIVPTLEGSRVVLVEIQALTAHTTLALPRRVGIGVDYNRLQLLLALLSRRFNSNLSTLDVFVNVAGGLKVNEPALDLGICLAVVSAFKGVPVPQDVSCFGEVGLLGEVRSVRFTKQRMQEVTRFGFTKVLLPTAFGEKLAELKKLAEYGEIMPIRSIQQAIQIVFKGEQ